MGRTRVQAIVIQNGKVLFGCGKGIHYFIGGALEDGETAEEGVLRELGEEANVVGTIVFKIPEPPVALISAADSPYSRNATYLVDIGNQVPIVGVDPEEQAEVRSDMSLASLEWVPLDNPVFFTWIDLSYFKSLRSECERQGLIPEWQNSLDGLLRIWRVR